MLEFSIPLLFPLTAQKLHEEQHALLSLNTSHRGPVLKKKKEEK